MAEKTVSERKLRYMEFLSRETGTRHHTDTEDMYQYELLRAGDPKAVEEAEWIFSSNLPGHVSDNPVRNYKYLFVASATLASRAAIAGGMEAAKNMLKFSEYSYSEIAATLAFSSQSHFTRAFKKRTGYTPKVYRDRFSGGGRAAT